MRELMFNYSLTDITPPEHLFLGGFANRKGVSGEIHRRLTSRCVVLKQEKDIICIIVNDLMDVDPRVIMSIKKRILMNTGIPDNSILIASIHTHSAPDISYGIYAANDRYIEFIINRISDNASHVISDDEGFTEAIVMSGKAECDINIARRDVKPEGGGRPYRVGDPGGLCDKEVGVLKLSDKTGQRSVMFFNYACHPVTLGYESNYVSTDYPGRAREIVEQKTGGMAVFLNGATGDINPREAHHADTSLTDKTGEQLGNAVIAADLTDSDDNSGFKILGKNINVPFRDQIITKEHVAAEAKRKASDATEFFTWKEMLDRWKKRVFEMIDNNEVETFFPIKINVVKIGRTILFFTQGELFVKYQIELKKKFPQYRIFCIAYVHGVGSYIPTADVFEKKGYETDQAYIYELLPSPLSPAIEEIYMKEAVNAINDVIK